MSLKRDLLRLRRRAWQDLNRILRGIDGRKVMFSCFAGKSYNDSPRCIAEELHRMRPDVKQVWVFDGKRMNDSAFLASLPDWITPVRAHTMAAYREYGTARVWVDNFTHDRDVIPHRGQYYIETWHGDRPIKKIAYDDDPSGYPRVEEKASLVLTSSDFSQKMYRTAFRYRGEYMNEGMPRNDALVRRDPAAAEKVRSALGIPEGTRLLLYAPTYREDTDMLSMEDQFDPAHVLQILEERDHCRWLMLYRAHYLAAGIEIDPEDPRFRDVTKWGEMTELLLAADLLITDYSSCGMDYCLLGRPVFFYQADYDHYVSTRELYYKPEEAPLLIAKTREELDELIRRTGPEEAKKNCDAMRAWYGIRETGRSAEAVCRWICDRLDGK